MCKRKTDSEFLTEEVDRIYNAVWEAVKEMAHKADDLKWDMPIIVNVCDYIQESLEERGISTCYPFQTDDGSICYASLDRCVHCTHE